MASGIYMIRCVPTGKVYVGSSTDIEKRWSRHRMDLSRQMHHSPHLQRSWDKHGADAFSWTILEHATEVILKDREQNYIDFYRSSDRRFGFNICRLATSSRGVVFSKETREKMSASRTGKVHSPETRKKLSVAARNRSPETNARIANGKRGKPMSPETKKKLRQANLGKRHSPESLAKIGIANRTRSPESRAKSAEAHAARNRSPESRLKNSLAQHKRYESPEVRQKYSIAMINLYQSPGFREKMSDCIKAAWARRKAATQAPARLVQRTLFDLDQSDGTQVA